MLPHYSPYALRAIYTFIINEGKIPELNLLWQYDQGPVIELIAHAHFP